MSVIQTSLSQFFKSYPHQPIVVAYSGGIDSQVLLHGLAHLKNQNLISNELSVCHVNHGLSVNALSWQHAAECFCQKLSLPIQTFQVKIKEITGQSLEAIARDARYKALKHYAPNNALIVTGHHLNDQSETFLLALKRGAGLKGLSAMSQVLRVKSQGHSTGQLLVRPLLKLTRKDIEHYAHEHGLTWVEDESNTDTRFDRNFIRHQVMPILTSRWPSILTTIKRSSEHCQEGQLLLTEMAREDLTSCQLSLSSLSVNELAKLSLARFNNLVRYFLEINDCLMPSSKQLKQVHQQMLAASDKVPQMKLSNYWLRRYKGSLFITDDYQELATFEYPISPKALHQYEQYIKLPDGLGQLSFITKKLTTQSPIKTEGFIEHYLKLPTSNEKVSMGFTHTNPRCLPDFRQHSRSLKKVLQELNIAPWQRRRIPFIFYNNTLVAAVGYFVCKDYMAVEGELSVLISWNKNQVDINY